jgi:hypothetical protein
MWENGDRSKVRAFFCSNKIHKEIYIYLFLIILVGFEHKISGYNKTCFVYHLDQNFGAVENKIM